MKNPFNYMMLLLVLAKLACGATSFNDNQPETDFNKAQWLIGTWENKTSRGSLFENWRKLNDTNLLGKSYKLTGADSLIFETVYITQKQQGLFYIPTVKDQNSGQPVSFQSTSVTENEMIFENKYHDFPQKITYKKVSKDSLVAEVSGMVEGKIKSQRFSMRRIK